MRAIRVAKIFSRGPVPDMVANREKRSMLFHDQDFQVGSISPCYSCKDPLYLNSDRGHSSAGRAVD